MRNTLIPAMLLLMVAGACDQKKKDIDVPEAVKVAFKAKFGDARNLEWSKENENEFEAEFESAAGKQSANFDSSGKWLVTETETLLVNLPEAVRSTIGKDYPSYKIEEAEKAETPNGTFYEVKIEAGENTLVIQITPEGQVIKSEEEKEEDEED